jgi:hypothetical protein
MDEQLQAATAFHGLYGMWPNTETYRYCIQEAFKSYDGMKASVSRHDIERYRNHYRKWTQMSRAIDGIINTFIGHISQAV